MKYRFVFEIDDKELDESEKELLLAFKDVLTRPESRFLVRHIILIGSYIAGLFVSKISIEELLVNVQTFVIVRFSKMLLEAGAIMSKKKE